ncbi:NUDIX domain-containing protein [Falsiroseomonas selenitidurans]|uniref:NUDIX domain-containing protein n=1 Tax=Falsiroseomonas selenitidurans TaxID=2716335 RepID=UPI001F275F9E|nr:NUDIX hydrolase [Falsiroseomonas selenitidurans]
MPDTSRPDIETLGSREIYRNAWMTVREDAIRRRDGSTGIYGVVEKVDFVTVVPVHADGSIQIVQQFRYPVGQRHWEFVQGMWGPPGTDPAEAARHELLEETGLAAAEWIHGGFLNLAQGTMRQGYDIYLARGLTQGAAMPELEEQDLVTRAVTLAEFERMLRAGEILDATTVASFGLLRLKGLI